MGLKASTSGGGTFENIPAGTYAGRCYRIIDLGTQRSEYQGKVSEKHKVLISWETPTELMDDGRPFTVHKRYTVSLHENAALYKDLIGWRGKPFTESELEGFELPKVLGAPCMLSILHNVNGGRTYANIDAIAKLPKGMECPPPVNAAITFDLDVPDWDVYEELSEGLQNTIAASPEFKAATGEGNEDEPTNGAVESTPTPVAAGDDFDDDIPF